jgi:glycolate oxidase
MENILKEKLVDLVGKKNFTDKLIDLVAYSKDASEHRHRPIGAVWPQNTQQVSAILSLANQEKLPVVARGAGTGLSGMAVPEKGGIVLDMARMNRILEIKIEDRLAVVQPGVVYAQLQKALEPYDFHFPPDPASGKMATLGGNVATNAGGLRGAKYGTTRDYVLGLEVVLADGSILKTGSRTMKCVSGYDLTRIFVGSEGTLGVITEITLKINPKPQASATCSAAFQELKQAGEAISEIMRSGITPSVLEILDEQCLLALNRHGGQSLPEAAAMVLAEADGYTREETEYQIAKIVEVFKKNQATHVTQAKSREEAEKLWAARRGIGGILYRLSYNLIAEDVTVPISRVPELLVGTQEISRRNQVLIPTLGHLGDGNLHPAIIFDGRNPEEKSRAEKAAEELFQLAIRLGGTLTGEHGIGLAKAPFMPLEHSPVAMRVMKGVKHLFDPNNILNPGKMGLEA